MNAQKLYLIPFLHQTTTITLAIRCARPLYLIPFLHQTTTLRAQRSGHSGCILFHFYIKPQQNELIANFFPVVSYSISTSNHNTARATEWAFRLYLIPFLHQTTTK